MQPLETREAVLRAVKDVLTERLPRSWEVTQSESAAGNDMVLVVASASGQAARFALSCSVTLNTDNAMRRAIDEAQTAAARIGGVPMVAARFLKAPQQAQLSGKGISYADATGNLRMLADEPAMFLSATGESKDPWRGSGRPKGRLRGQARAQLVRALVDFTPPYSVADLMKLSGTGGSATYALVDYLYDAELVEQERPNKPRGNITSVDWRELLTDWSRDYGFLPSNPVATYLQPRGLDRLINDLRKVDGLRYAVTGSQAAARIAPYAEPRAAMIYCDDPVELAKKLKLRSSEAGANVMLAPTPFEAVYQRCTVDDGIVFTAVSQAAVDLLTGPGRSREEADYLMDWMGDNIELWRIPGHGEDPGGSA